MHYRSAAPFLAVVAVLALVVAVLAPDPGQHTDWVPGNPSRVGMVIPAYASGVPVAIHAADEIPRVEFPTGSGETYEHPTVISRMVHSIYTDWVFGEPDPMHVEWVRTAAEWLVEHLERRSSASGTRTIYGVWPLPMDLPEFGTTAGWTSGFTNAAGALALYQAGRMHPDARERYEAAAELAVEAFQVDVGDGGLITRHDDTTCIEEVAAPAQPTCILNGHIFAMTFLATLARGGGPDLSWLLDEAFHQVVRTIGEYSEPFASRYSPDGKFAEPDGYNLLHIDQMIWLYGQTGHAGFLDYAALWAQFEAGGYVATLQSSPTVEPILHGPGVLHDGPAWFGYWSAREAPIAIEIELATTSSLCGVNVFFAGSAPSILPTFTTDSELRAVSIVDRTSSGTRPTEVVAYRFESCRSASSLTVSFDRGDAPVIAIREVDPILADDGLLRDAIARYESRVVHATTVEVINHRLLEAIRIVPVGLGAD